MPKTTMRVAVVNVPVKVREQAWLACFYLATSATPLGAFGINENLAPAQRRVYKQAAKALGYGRFGLHSPNPVFWDKARWRLLEGSVHQLHPPGSSTLARRWPGYNAARSATVVVLEDRDTREQVTIVCTHWAPQGKKVPSLWGAWARQQAKQQIRGVVRTHLRADRPVWVIGDLNVHGLVDMAMRRFQWLRGEGVDKVGVALPRGTQLEHSSVATVPAPTDHKHLAAATASWTRSQ